MMGVSSLECYIKNGEINAELYLHVDTSIFRALLWRPSTPEMGRPLV